MAFQPMFTFTKTVALAATPEALFSSRQPFKSITIQAKSTNGGYVEIQLTGDAAGEGVRLTASSEAYTIDASSLGKMNLDAAAIFIRVEVNGEGVQGFGLTE